MLSLHSVSADRQWPEISCLCRIKKKELKHTNWLSHTLQHMKAQCCSAALNHIPCYGFTSAQTHIQCSLRTRTFVWRVACVTVMGLSNQSRNSADQFNKMVNKIKKLLMCMITLLVTCVPGRFQVNQHKFVYAKKQLCPLFHSSFTNLNTEFFKEKYN